MRIIHDICFFFMFSLCNPECALYTRYISVSFFFLCKTGWAVYMIYNSISSFFHVWTRIRIIHDIYFFFIFPYEKQDAHYALDKYLVFAFPYMKNRIRIIHSHFIFPYKKQDANYKRHIFIFRFSLWNPECALYTIYISFSFFSRAKQHAHYTGYIDPISFFSYVK